MPYGESCHRLFRLQKVTCIDGIVASYIRNSDISEELNISRARHGEGDGPSYAFGKYKLVSCFLVLEYVRFGASETHSACTLYFWCIF